jgi:hypothetical protein
VYKGVYSHVVCLTWVSLANDLALGGGVGELQGSTVCSVKVKIRGKTQAYVYSNRVCKEQRGPTKPFNISRH